jgi:glycosyltransferase involved in cell wall biosynthesis
MPLRVCVVNDHFSWQGGGHLRMQNLAMGLKELGNDVVLISPSWTGRPDTIPTSASVPTAASPLTQLLSDLELARKVSRMDCDLLVITLPNTMLKAISGLHRRSDSLVVFDMGGLWTSMLDLGRTPANLGKWRYMRPASQILEDFITLALSHLPNAITTPTNMFTNLIQRLTRAKNVFTIHNPVDTHRLFNPSLYEPNQVIPDLFREKILVALAVKGQSYAEVMSFLERTHLRDDVAFQVMGPRPAGLTLSDSVRSRFWFTGQLSYLDVPKYLSACSLAIALGFGGFERLEYAPHNVSKIADYLSMGLPVITNTLSSAEYVLDSGAGFLARNLDDALRITNELLKIDGKLRELGARARTYAVNELDSLRVARRFLRLLEL